MRSEIFTTGIRVKRFTSKRFHSIEEFSIGSVQSVMILLLKKKPVITVHVGVGRYCKKKKKKRGKSK